MKLIPQIGLRPRRNDLTSMVRVVSLAILTFVAPIGCSDSAGCSRYTDCDYDSEISAEEGPALAPSDVEAADVEAPTFDNCTDDCSGHDAGFEWARENDFTDSAECGGNSQSFIEGCEAFTEERQALADAQSEEQASEDDAFEQGEY